MENADQWWVLLRTLGSLALVISLILALGWVAKRFLEPRKLGGRTWTGIRVIQSLPIGAKKRLMVVEVEGKRLLIGVGGDSISALSELDPAGEQVSDLSAVRKLEASS